MCGELFSICSADDRGPEQGASVFRSNFGVSEAALKTAASHFEEVVQECDDVRMRDELFSRCSADGRGPEQGASSLILNSIVCHYVGMLATAAVYSLYTIK